MAERLSSKKLKEKLERKKRYQLEKDYSNALKRGPTKDRPIAQKQHAFCVKLIKDILDDETSLSFSKPVTELWDVDDLPGYFDKVSITSFMMHSSCRRIRLRRASFECAHMPPIIACSSLRIWHPLNRARD